MIGRARDDHVYARQRGKDHSSVPATGRHLEESQKSQRGVGGVPLGRVFVQSQVGLGLVFIVIRILFIQLQDQH